MATTTIPAAKAALKTLLETNVHEVPVYWTAPAQIVPGDEGLSLGPVADIEREWGAMGLERPIVDETYTLTIVIHVAMEGDEPQETDERFWDIVAQLENAIQSDHTLGGLVMSARPAGLVDQDLSVLTPDAWAASGIYRVVCNAIVY